MAYDLIVRPDAELDLVDAFEWYEEKRTGLGHDFLIQIDAGLKHIKRTPNAHAIIYQSARIHLIKRFPYKIIYLVKEEKIIVLGVIHASRNTTLIKKRTKGD